ncbi:hypothetical protein [Croceitalea rosinachiae]|uniref:Uncharacterized protein n=1 Tax=Croceitalea rosinachiae TaxID=3075596 RepID=A0ABU3ADB3_9FLAO|nr:hypothetical protein [Croceitalea sp. F388]MDT0607908.1 hypothetical protein [Croceitalea sp. F388]
MKLSIRNALYIAGAILLAAALISQFKDADLIWATLMVLTSVIILLWAYREDKKLSNCKKSTNSKKKIFGLTLGIIAIFLGLGFSIGKLIYLWSH